MRTGQHPTPLPLPLFHQLATVALATTALLALTPPPALADPASSITSVTPTEAVAAARPLPKPAVDKGRVWAFFAFGAAGTFGAALAAERVEALFPAIAKANREVAAARARGAREEAAAAAEGGLEDAVAAGLEEARRRGGGEGGGGEGG